MKFLKQLESDDWELIAGFVLAVGGIAWYNVPVAMIVCGAALVYHAIVRGMKPPKGD